MTALHTFPLFYIHTNRLELMRARNIMSTKELALILFSSPAAGAPAAAAAVAATSAAAASGRWLPSPPHPSPHHHKGILMVG